MENSRFDLTGKVAIVTGGTGVLGKAMLKGLIEHGATGIILGRNPEKIAATLKELKEASLTADGFTADVLNEQELEKARGDILSKYKKIDILVNAAGGHVQAAVQQPDQTIFDIELDAIRETIDLNMFGTIYPTLIFGKSMVVNGQGSIVNITSMAAMSAISRVMGYSLAKSAIDTFTRWMSMELGFDNQDRIRINAIAPGFFLTEQNKKILLNEDGSLTKRAEKILEHTPVGRLGEPDELISTLVWLCSDASKFVTGTIVPVDGGFSKYSGV